MKPFEDLDLDRVVILDTETTGFLSNNGEVIEIAVVAYDGSVLLDTLIKPQGANHKAAQAVHLISDEVLAVAPSFPEVFPRIVDALSGRQVVIYNVAFDTVILQETAKRYNLSFSSYMNHWCLMEAYAEYWGDEGFYGFKPQSLAKACKQQSIEISNAHRAIGDCRMTLNLLKHLVAKQE